MEEQRRGGFRVKPSFGQVLSYFCHFVHSNVERRLVAGENRCEVSTPGASRARLQANFKNKNNPASRGQAGCTVQESVATSGQARYGDRYVAQQLQNNYRKVRVNMCNHTLQS